MPCHDVFDHFWVGPCAPEHRRAALLELAGVFDPALQGELQAALNRAKHTPEFDWQGLWVAKRAGRIEAAAWVEPRVEMTARLWLPKQYSKGVDALLAGLRQWVGRQGFALCHVTLNEEQRHWEAPLVASGMHAIATLEHLEVTTERQERVAQTLHVTPFGELDRPRQLALLRGIREDSQDCPALLEALSIETLLAGFLAQAPDAPANWYRVGRGDETVGALLLTAQTPRRWVLQLMGLLPAWRGNGLGRALVAQAKTRAFQGGAHRLGLSVDAHNTPAKRLYTQAGFHLDRRQRLYAWRR